VKQTNDADLGKCPERKQNYGQLDDGLDEELAGGPDESANDN
jgi:hypothetical protein